MESSQKNHSCLHCYSALQYGVEVYSAAKFGVLLCRTCQEWYKERLVHSTKQAILLFLALKKRNVPVELEKFDGYKRIDIAITRAMVNIEVDGQHHNYKADQALSDLQRTLYSFKKGYLTLRIPNSLVESHLEQTANYIRTFVYESIGQLKY